MPAAARSSPAVRVPRRLAAQPRAGLTRAAAFRSIAPDTDDLPLYRAVQRSLLAAIENGAIALGQPLPSEGELASAFGVSIGTLRRAVDDLVADRVLVRKQGRGTFVATHGGDRYLFQFFHVERSDGRREMPQVELLSFSRGRADDEAASMLGVPAGDAVFEIENRLSLQGRAVVHDRLVVPVKLFRGLTEKRLRERSSTIYHLYQSEFGITVVRAEERLRAIAADRSAARVLGVAVGAPVLQVRRAAIALGGRAVEFRVSTVLTGQHDYVSRLQRPA